MMQQHILMLQKRDAPALLKEIQRGSEPPIYRWQLASEKIVGGTPATPLLQ
jgi:hypothetical protein